jgi:DNA ligase-1
MFLMRIPNYNFTLTSALLILMLPIATILVTQKGSAEILKKPKIQQGVTVTPDKLNTISQYLVSEKLDGMRGFWTGKQLISRQGNLINTPKWFTKNWPTIPMDGELWLGRNTFQSLMSCIKSRPILEEKSKNCWVEVQFMIFDLPEDTNQFHLRVKQMNHLVQKTNSDNLGVIKQEILKGTKALDNKLTTIMNGHGEGLMLHLANAYYKVGRNKALLKLKRFDDSEAIVIAYTAGKGKYTGMLGALKVKTADGIIFKIGSGFSDTERKNPPAIGSIITYKHNGLTKAGIPRFARFWRIRLAN